MKKLLIINPNSSEEMTRDIRNTLAYAQDGDFALEVVSTPGSPHVLESFSDYTEAGANAIALLRRLAAQGPFPYDGVLLACMGDPCLFAVKEACPVPLVGIAEAGISTALLLGYKSAAQLYRRGRIETPNAEAIRRLDDAILHETPYISDYI